HLQPPPPASPAPGPTNYRYSPYYADIHLVVNWEYDGREIRSFIDPVTKRTYSRPQSIGFYFRPGLTWPRRSSNLSFRVLPTASIFADKGPAAFIPQDKNDALCALAATMNSRPFYGLVHALVARVTLAQTFDVGLVQSVPLPDLDGEGGTRLA